MPVTHERQKGNPLTYCVAIRVSQGLVFVADSRTNAGADQLGTVSKLHRFEVNSDRAVCILTAGNLATTQAVIRQVRRDLEKKSGASLNRFTELAEAAEYIGRLSRSEQAKHSSKGKESFNPEANFIIGGQIHKRPHQIYHVYPEGNYISASERTPYLQIGELKYGKPILDRIIKDEVTLEVAGRCALVSMDSTMRSNATVGPPIELLTYIAGSMRMEKPLFLDEGHPYLQELRIAWQAGLQQAFENLPGLPFIRPAPHLVDAARGEK
ncbi:MAG TPA: 20S proteasome subunit A/B [Xanthomonadales bacterium]|nr:20S proteasome subunit A/B [Xanthomonadales bacterium]